jgi:hypothetical protein
VIECEFVFSFAVSDKKNNAFWETQTIRKATLEDLGTVMHHRRSMFKDMGHTDVAALDAMHATSEPFFSKGLSDGSYQGWLVENEAKKVIPGGGIIIFDIHSSPLDPSPKRPVIVKHVHRARVSSAGNCAHAHGDDDRVVSRRRFWLRRTAREQRWACVVRISRLQTDK